MRRGLRGWAGGIAAWLMALGPAGGSAEAAAGRQRNAPSEARAAAGALAVPDLAWQGLRHLAILHNGRLKPFEGFARETLQLITGSPRWERQDPVVTVLSVGAEPSGWADAPILSVPFLPLRQQLGIDAKVSHVSYNELVLTRALMRRLPAIVAKQARDEKLTMLEEETLDLYHRFVAFTTMLRQQFLLIPPTDPQRAEWRPILETSLRATWEALMEALRRGDGAQAEQLANDLAREARRVDPAAYPPAWRLRLEVGYHRAAPFAIARGGYALAIPLLLIGLWGAGAGRRWSRWGLGLVIVACAVHAMGILMRVVIGGRPPVSNFYETMLWLPFVAVVLGLVFDWAHRSRLFSLCAAVVAAITLLVADYVPLDASIAPVVAVLRSNLWLTIHVLTIVASYGALALATVLAHVYAGVHLARRLDAVRLAAMEQCLYRVIQVGVVLLSGGIMLGAVWANASWGRYWGWDPKETWALITLLWYLAVLHGRFAGWLGGLGVAVGTIAGFLLLLMTYYGVSFYLVGLHSYAGGRATPLPPLLLAYLAAELSFLSVVGLAALRRKRTT